MGKAVLCPLLILICVSAAAQTGSAKTSSDTSVPSIKTNLPLSSPLFTSRYDFVPGEKIIRLEDFSETETGDFPTGWNTNASAEIVTVKDQEGKWLKISKGGSFYPEIIQSLPQNATLEFYLQGGSKVNPVPLVLNFGTFDNPGEFKYLDGQNPALRGKPVLQLKFWPEYANKPASSELIIGRKGPNYDIQNKNSFKSWDKSINAIAHVALWRQADRLRVYINGEKIWDVPRAFDTTAKYHIVFAMPRTRQADDYYLLGNIRLAVGMPDTRNKLLKEGRFVTQGILFNTGSNQIKPESYGVLKEIAAVLQESPFIRIKIIGHTDSEGDEKSNLLLSQRRALAVKSALLNMSIKEERLETDGKGQSKPVAENKTKEGRAQNRRVEFIKL